MTASPRQPPRIPAGVAGNRFSRKPKAAMCGRPCSSVRQGERRKSPHFTLPAAPHSRRCFGKLPPAAIRKLRCADGLAFQRGRASGGTPRKPPRIPAGVEGNRFSRNPKAAMCGRPCSSVWQYERTNPLRKPPRIPAGVAGNSFPRNPEVAMCGRNCFSVRQGERMNGTDAADSPPDDAPRNLPVVGACFDAEYGLRAPLLSKRRARMNNQCILKSSA